MYNCVSVHGHFYQPPRKNPFTGKMPIEFIGDKFQNWNQRINEDCYKPNADKGNFELISFDLYRSLAEWMEEEDPETYHKIIRSDNVAYEKNGIGTAFCGSWDHAILPLMADDDIELEIYWGYVDFLKRFKHAPIGFWLAETAVSNKVLDILAKSGLRLVILAPWQTQNPVNTTKLHWVELLEGRRISVAFYDKDISSALSFDNNSMSDADRFTSTYIPQKWKQEGAHILGATDGERYGHHLKSGENFLHRMLTESLESTGFKATTVMNQYAQSPILDQAFIQDNTSWSCLCGDLKRWKQDCECSVDYDDYNKRVSGEWKSFLFKGISNLSESLVDYSMKILRELVKDPHHAMKEYIHVHLRQVTESEFILKHKLRDLKHQEVTVILKICAMQISRLASFTSCGWFFSDIDRPEPRIVIGNAKKALAMLAEIGHVNKVLELEEKFIAELQNAKSNRTSLTGRDLYLEYAPVVGA
jgi:Domain of unknown function (DUF3536)/Glycosyl hydrolase family 57